MASRIIEADCLAAMAEMDEASVDAVVCDPPYGLEFMGKEWDAFRLDDPGTARHRGEHAGTHGELHSDPDPEPDAHPARNRAGVAYGGGKRPTTHRCAGCGKRDQFRNPHEPCGEAAEWRVEIIDPHAAPPTMLAFQEWSRRWALEAKRVLRPGGHLLAFGGTRTYHRLACAVEDAGFEIRDSVIWIYGSGFPKSLDVSKAIDKASDCLKCEGTGKIEAGERGVDYYAEPCERCEGTGRATREVVGSRISGGMGQGRVDSPLPPSGIVDGAVNQFKSGQAEIDVTAPATPQAQQWQGWGTALKPAHEPIVLARKPLVGTVAANVLEHGTGALNVDGCRIGSDVIESSGWTGMDAQRFRHGTRPRDYTDGADGATRTQHEGRWPANLTLSHLPECERVGVRRVKASLPASGPTHEGPSDRDTMSGDFKGMGDRAPANYADPDGTETIPAYSCAPGCPVAMLDEQSGEQRSGTAVRTHGISAAGMFGFGNRGPEDDLGYGDTGGASRFFATFQRPDQPRFRYSSKASRGERNAGLEGLPEGDRPYRLAGHDWTNGSGDPMGPVKPQQNVHPTVKPIDLMRWLCRLVTPPGGVILDPFTGSGTTGIAAHLEGFEFIGIEREPEYAEIARARIAWWERVPPGTSVEAALGLDGQERTMREAGQESLFR